MQKMAWSRRRASAFLLVAILTTVVATSPALGADDEESWQPPRPMPDHFDWVQMTSGEWLKGEMIAMYDDVLEFDSDEFDLQSLDLEDIQQIRSAQIVQVAFLDDTIAIGKLLLDGGEVRVFSETEVHRKRDQILSITPGAPRERNYWSGKIGAGLNYRTGNTNQTEFNANLGLKRRTPKNRVTLDYLGNFTENEGETIADNQRASASWNRFLSDRFFLIPLYGEYYRDPFQNIARRLTLGVGAGYQIVDTSKVWWDVNAGIGYQEVRYEDVQEGEPDSANTPALMFSTNYGNELTGWMDYFLNFQFSIVSEESGTYHHHLLTGFEFDFFGDFDLDLTWVWDRVQDPVPNADATTPKKDDFRMIVSLGYSF
jgi:putative salt-induced outer membrane protein YdiY